MNIPESSKLNTSALARLFDNKSESYKLFWFKAILHEVAKGEKIIYFKDLINRMIIDAWYMVSEYKLNLGPSDTLEKTVLYISGKEQFLPTEKEETLINYLHNTDDKKIKEFIRTLSLNVPYRLQAPLMDTPAANVWYKASDITNYINSQPGMIYMINRNGYHNNSCIVINDDWMDYLISNLGILIGWTDYNLILYLQRRNPTVPGIANKIYPPQERKLSLVTGYWKYLIQNTKVYDIYTDCLLSTKDLSIDHFVPWSYIASDELWNLAPTSKSVNSSKSNNLPNWNVYFGRLAKLEYDAYVFTEKDEKASTLFKKCAKENLNSEDIKYKLYKPGQSEERFKDQLHEIIFPIYEAAKNMGFKEWVYKK